MPRPHSGQLRVVREAARFNVLECGRRFGKTKLGIRVSVHAAATSRLPVGWFAPTYKYLADVWREVVQRVGVAGRTNTQEHRIELISGGAIDFWTLDQPNPGRGRKYKRVVIDEAGIVRNLEDAWTNAIRPTLADYKGDAWFLGTPKGSGNFFHRLFSKGESGAPGWKSWRLPTTANPYIDPAEIEDARRDMPDAAFKQEFLGIPADDGGNPFGLKAIRECTVEALGEGPTTAFGIDLAKSLDWSVVCGMNEGGSVCHLDRWQSDWRQTRQRIIDTASEVGALVDSTGVGDPVLEDLQSASGRFEGFKFSASSKQQLMEGLAASIQRREIRFPRGWLTNELESFEYQFSASGVRYSAPEGLHDDGVVALALAVSKWKKPLAQEVENVVYLA